MSCLKIWWDDAAICESWNVDLQYKFDTLFIYLYVYIFQFCVIFSWQGKARGIKEQVHGEGEEGGGCSGGNDFKP